MLWLAVAFAAAGCAQQPVMRVQMTAAPQGIDNVIYGPAPAYGTAAAPASSAAATRGYFASSGPAYAMAAPTYAMAPAPMMAAPALAPAYGAAAPPLYASAAPPTYGNAAAPQLYASTAQPAYGMAAAPLYASAAAPDASGRGITGGIAVGNGRVAAAPASYSSYPSYSGGYAPNLQYPYSLDSGDRLRIVVFGQEGLTNSYVLDASGQLQMPLIGAVAARGLTTDQLTERIGEMLRQGFIREPHVAVEIEGYRPFFILGEVTQPGQYPYVANMTVETAVAIAGGFGPRAQRKQITISRNFGGQVMRFEAPVSYPLRPGDTIQVQERWF
jgi:polysaccharide export outer membrane protein